MGRAINEADIKKAIATMQTLFPNQDFSNDGVDLKKLNLFFDMLIQEECTDDELRLTMKRFVQIHQSTNWMPADLYTLHRKLNDSSYIS